VTHVPLPDDAWAELISPRKVKERDRRRYLSAMVAFRHAIVDLPREEDGNIKDDSYGPEHSEMLNSALDLLTVALVKAWSFEVPVSVEALGDLSADAADALRAAVIDARGEVTPDYSPVPDPKVGSGGSPPPLMASSMDGSMSTTR